ncbi:MAG: M14 family metallopeptidase [Gemmatimonadota bacterium]|nr:M14 family metallopeptidase [Gemmatimonadota bacterium]
MRALRILAATAVLLGAPPAIGLAQQVGPPTRAERTDFRETSRYEDVVETMTAVAEGSEAIALDTLGYSFEGRALPMARWGEGPTRTLVFANIHAGEVAGKESALLLLRDLAGGRHAGWADRLTVWVAPIYNADGNERIALTNRPLQHGPIGGMGIRSNAQGLDLNRDFTKLEAPESRSLVAFLDAIDPHLVVDLHTTNGTIHGYDLTYSPPLHPDTDEAIVRFLRDSLLPTVTRAMREEGEWRAYHYGNLPDFERLEGRRGWYTYDPGPRYSTNYVGLRNRLAILSEAYAYLSFEERIDVTRRFVEEILDFAARHGERIREIVDSADRRAVPGEDLAVETEFALVDEDAEILLGEVEEESHPYTGEPMLRKREVVRVERMPEYTAFRATATETAPAAYLVPSGLEEMAGRLEAHGAGFHRLAEARELDVEVFRIAASSVAERAYQGHRRRTLEGSWEEARRTVPAGTIVVPMDQPLARLAFQLLEPRAPDGFAAWNLLDGVLEGSSEYPIIRTFKRLPAPAR